MSTCDTDITCPKFRAEISLLPNYAGHTRLENRSIVRLSKRWWLYLDSLNAHFVPANKSTFFFAKTIVFQTISSVIDQK